MTNHDLEARLSFARERLEKATEALAPKHQGGEWAEYRAAHDLVLRLERELATAKGEEHAVPLDFPVEWDTGAPLPHVLQNDNRTFLTFYVREPDPAWDGTYVTVKEPGSAAEETIAVAEFVHCMAAKLGSPNDEDFHGHPLHGKGLDCYTAQLVVNSRWLAELERINSVHDCYNPSRWELLHHYVFWFHDTTFECIAESFNVEVHRKSMIEILEVVCKRLLA